MQAEPTIKAVSNPVGMKTCVSRVVAEKTTNQRGAQKRKNLDNRADGF